jgi:hypothetical protein
MDFLAPTTLELLYGYSTWEELSKLNKPRVTIEKPKSRAKIVALPFRARRQAGEREELAA